MNFEQLSAFLESADCGSFSAGARKLGKSMPAVSQLVANLEIDLDLKLFDRSGRYPTLTKDGMVLYDYIKRSMEMVAEVQLKAQSLNAGVESCLAIGFEAALYQPFIDSLLVEFSQAFPRVDLDIRHDASGGLRHAIINGELDLAVGYFHPEATEYHAYGFAMDTIAAVVSADHPMSTGPVDEGLLGKFRQLSLRSAMDFEGAKHSVNLWVIDRPEQLVRLLCRGLGWAYLPIKWVEQELCIGSLVEMELSFLKQHMVMEVELMSTQSIQQGPVLRWWYERIQAEYARRQRRLDR